MCYIGEICTEFSNRLKNCRSHAFGCMEPSASPGWFLMNSWWPVAPADFLGCLQSRLRVFAMGAEVRARLGGRCSYREAPWPKPHKSPKPMENLEKPEKSRISRNSALRSSCAPGMISGGSPTLGGLHRPPGTAAIAFARACDGRGGLGEAAMAVGASGSTRNWERHFGVTGWPQSGISGNP